MIRVVLADDSPTARELLRAILEAEGDISVIAEAANGHEAVDQVERHHPDLVVMDVHMPGADGLDATKEIMMRAPTPIVIVSSITHRDVDLSLSATQAGALIALPKPDSPASPRFAMDAHELRGMVRAMSQVKVVRRWSSGPQRNPTPRGGRRSAGAAPELIVMAASTGGPAALRSILLDLPRTLRVPLLIVQHIARGFTAGFAEWLGGGCALPVRLAAEGEPLRAGVVYVAPDDRHLGVDGEGCARLSASGPIGGFRPSANYLFESAGHVYGPSLIAVILTGMGSDGADGLEKARAAGAYVVAQDEPTSVVYGMAQEAVRRGVVDAVVPLEGIAGRLMELVQRGNHAR